MEGDPTEGALIVAARKFGIDKSGLARFPALPKSPSPLNASATPRCIATPITPDVCASSSRVRRKSCSRKATLSGRTARPSPSTSDAAPNCRRATRRLPARRCARSRWPRAPSRPPLRYRCRRQAAIRIRTAGQIEDDLVLLGLVGMIDPPRAEAKAAVAVRQAGAHPHRDDHRRPPGDRRSDRP